MLSRIGLYSEIILGDYQYGFRRNPSAVGQIVLLKQLMKKKWEYAQSIHSIFVDFAKAYDGVDKLVLYNILSSFKIPYKLVRMIKVTIKESDMVVREGTDVTEVLRAD